MNEVNFKQVIQNIREAINPETRIPEEQKDNPLYYRIERLKALITEIQQNQNETNDKINKVITNFNELLSELHKTHEETLDNQDSSNNPHNKETSS